MGDRGSARDRTVELQLAIDAHSVRVGVHVSPELVCAAACTRSCSWAQLQQEVQRERAVLERIVVPWERPEAEGLETLGLVDHPSHVGLKTRIEIGHQIANPRSACRNQQHSRSRVTAKSQHSHNTVTALDCKNRSACSNRQQSAPPTNKNKAQVKKKYIRQIEEPDDQEPAELEALVGHFDEPGACGCDLILDGAIADLAVEHAPRRTCHVVPTCSKQAATFGKGTGML